MAVQPLWDHQKIAKERASKLNYFALFFEQGCGKTRTLIEILRDKIALEGRPLKTLIICPPIVIHNWLEELQAFGDFKSNELLALIGSGEERLKLLEAAPSHAIVVCNYQTLLMPPVLKALKKRGMDVLVLDESHKIKSYNSKTSKKVLSLGEDAKYRYCLSGTPVLNSYFDIYPQAAILDDGRSLGSTFFAFRHRFFVDKNAGRPKNCYFPNWVPREGAEKEIKEAVAPFSMRVFKEDCLDLPPLIRQKVYVDMDPIQARVYKDLDQHMVAALGEQMIVSDMAVTNIMRMQQVVSGFGTDSIGRTFKFENPRLDALIEVIENIDPKAKIIVWAVFRQNYYSIKERLDREKILYEEVTGEVPQSVRQAKINTWKDDERIRVLVANQSAAGIGINLTEASYSIYFSRDYSLANDLQSEARNYRAGSERHEKVTRIDLVTPGTIDEVILQALAAKGNLGATILQHYQTRKN